MAHRLPGQQIHDPQVRQNFDYLLRLIELLQQLIDDLPPPGGGGDALRYAETVGDGASATIEVVHDLGTEDVLVQVYEESSGEQVYCDVDTIDTDTIELGFGAAPATDSLRVRILA